MGKRRKKKRAAGAQEAPLKGLVAALKVAIAYDDIAAELATKPTNRNQLDVVSARLLAFAEKMGLVKQ